MLFRIVICIFDTLIGLFNTKLKYFKQILVYFVFLSFNLHSQDTVFIKSLPIGKTVVNITSGNGELFIRSADSIYRWKNSALDFVSEAKLRYSWVKEDQGNFLFSHSATIPISRQVKRDGYKNLIPGTYNANISSERINNDLFVAYNGNLLQYLIREDFDLKLRGTSIRHIFSEPYHRVISTYSGIFIDTLWDKFVEIKLEGPLTTYSNGCFIKIMDRYFLCQDDLLEYDAYSKQLILRKADYNDVSFRNLFEFGGRTFAIMTFGFYQLNFDNYEFEQEFLHSKEITDYEVIGDNAYLSCKNGGVYVLDSSLHLRNICTQNGVNNICTLDNDLMLFTDNGLFKFDLNSGSLEQLTEQKELHSAVKFKNGLIYSGNRGLYWYSENESRTLINNTEFNKFALLTDKHYLYAGGVNGLYMITVADLELLLALSSNKINKHTQGSFWATYGVLIIVFLLIILLTIILFRKNKKSKLKAFSPAKITSESVKALITNNESIKSVEGVAQFFNTSVSQVNRRLKLENTTPLLCLKEVKKEIAIKMIEEENSIEEIAKRVGYSKRYIKEKLLK